MKKHSLSQELFKAYIGWFIFFIIILLSVSIGFIGLSIKKDFADTQNQLINSINENVQSYFEEMNAFSIDLINSTEFKEVALKQLTEEYESGKSTTGSFSKLYQIAYRMIQKNYSIGVVVNDEYYIWMGQNYHIHKITRTQIHTYDDLVRNERPVVKYLEENEYLQFSGTEKGKDNGAYITLSRSMDTGRKYLNGRHILEIQVKKEDFANTIRSLSGDDGSVQINIFDSEGNCLYKESTLDLSEYVNEGKNSYNENSEIIDICKTFDDNLTVVYTRNTKGYTIMLYVFWIIAFCVGAAYVAVISWKTYHTSKRISEPIYRIYDQIRDIDLKEGKSFQGIETNIYELQVLSNSIKEMNEELKKSLQQIIIAKDYELHAKMLALQAQMQPHFLFNTLMNVASMAEAEGNNGIYRICMNLTNMFRYISADNPEGVCLYEEIRHVENYVEIMKERFQESQVDIDVPLELMSVLIPKLTIQPLVENAFKYCDRQRPEIKIRGIVGNDGSWTVEVQDNGKGFSHDKKMEIMRKCEESLENEKILSSQIDGMGLVNVFVRLQLFYGKNNFVYSIGENQGNVVVGRRNGENVF